MANVVPRSLRTYLLSAIALILLPIIYLSYSHRMPYVSTHEHPLAAAEDVGLAFPNDPIYRREFETLSKYPAQNINEPSKFAFSTFYCTRQPDRRGPYFESTQQIIWRLLWSDYHSKYPIIVFVCPFIPEENRMIFRGQGAIVKEIELLDDIIPDEIISTKRWIDVLSKLNLWKEIEWKKLVFLDADAFPMQNIDDIFDLVPTQKCNKTLLSDVDRKVVENGIGGEEMCDYIYAGVQQFTADNINAGMLVIKPNLDMHAKLLRAARSTDDYRPQDMEQGVLKSKNAFAFDGPFPVHHLPQIWNALPEYYIDYRAKNMEATEGKVRILHAKMWNRFWGNWNNLTELNDRWDISWMNMCRFYDGEDFVEARETGVYKSLFEKFIEMQSAQSAAST